MEKGVERPNGFTLVKEFVDEFFSLKKGVLYTIGLSFLRPWYVFQQYVNGKTALISSPLKLVLTISPLLILLSSITPTSEIIQHVSEDLNQLTVDERTGPSAPTVTEETSGDDFGLERVSYVYDIMDEYPVIEFLISVIFFGLAIKTVFFKTVRLFEALTFSGYMSIPVTIFTKVLSYSLIWGYGYNAGFSIILGVLHASSVLLTIVYLYGYSRNIHKVSQLKAVIYAIVFIVLMHIYTGIAATFTSIFVAIYINV